jgi:hypothetical protein
LSDRINGNIIRSEIEGGVDLRQLPPESKLKVETRNRAYTIVMKCDCNALISGHPDFCPSPVLVRIHYSFVAGRMIGEIEHGASRIFEQIGRAHV